MIAEKPTTPEDFLREALGYERKARFYAQQGNAVMVEYMWRECNRSLEEAIRLEKIQAA